MGRRFCALGEEANARRLDRIVYAGAGHSPTRVRLPRGAGSFPPPSPPSGWPARNGGRRGQHRKATELVTLKGPGVFVAAEVSNQGGSNEVDPVGRTTGRGLLVGFSAAPLS